MNRIVISAEEVPLPAWHTAARRFVLKALALLGRDNWELSILLCGDRTIAALNSRYRGKDEPTDILSFSLGEGEPFPQAASRMTRRVARARNIAGDIVISLDTLQENAVHFGISEDEELRRLLIHGILHLDGMDHRGNGEEEPMLQLQEQILAQLSGECILGRAA